MIKLLFQRLLSRGYEDSSISPVFNETALKIEAKFINKPKKKTELLHSGNRIFFHLQYHNRDASKHCIRNAYMQFICSNGL